MTVVRPRRLVFHGRAQVSGLHLGTDLLGEAEARRRVLSLWEPGCSVHAVTGGYVLRWSTPRPCTARDAVGAPLVERLGVLLCAPLRSEELQQLGAPASGVVLVRGGRAHHEALGDVVDVSNWLDLGRIDVVPVHALGEAPQAARFVATGPSPDADARDILGETIPAASPELAKVLEALRKPRASGSGGSTLGGQFYGPAGSPPQPSRLGTWVAGLFARSPLATAIGRKQARYLENMLSMFEGGDLDKALRHAIPFGSLPGAPMPPKLGLLSPRAELDLSPAMTYASSTVNLGGELYEKVKTLYQEAARKLEEQGRIEEAAFVLFQLLGENLLGVALLERHERWKLAAQMAEGRELAPDLIIRLWILAGDAQRAVLVARRTGAFGSAVALLERGCAEHRRLAEGLRLAWGDWLAAAGEYSTAVDAIWPVTRARRLALAWIDRGIEQGGPPAGRMLARKVQLLRAIDDETRTHVLNLCAAEAAVEDRTALAAAWAQLPVDLLPLCAGLGRRIWRALLHDVHAGADKATRTALTNLARWLRDPLIKTDMPAFRTTVVDVSTTNSPYIDANDRGLHDIVDLVWLPNGRAVVALGEAGLAVLSREGKSIAHIRQPAHRIVLADSGAVAIVIAPRGASSRLARIDLVRNTGEHWCDARFDVFAADYDGARWFVGMGDLIAMIDTQVSGFTALWRASQLSGKSGGKVIAIARETSRMALLLRTEHHVETWSFETAWQSPVLRSRGADPFTLADDAWLGFAATGATASVQRSETQRGALHIRTLGSIGGRCTETDGLRMRPLGVHPWQGGALLWMREESGVVVRKSNADGLLAGELWLEGARKAIVHPQGQSLAIGDDRGRVLELRDAGGFRLERNLRF